MQGSKNADAAKALIDFVCDLHGGETDVFRAKGLDPD